MHVIGIHNEREDRKNSWRHRGLKLSKFDKNYKSTDPRSSMIWKDKKTEQNFSKAYHDLFAYNQC